MIAYVTIGTNDLEASAKFYDALLGELGAVRALENERVISWSAKPGTPMIGLIKPFDGEAAAVGNGSMVSLAADSSEMVDALHKKALEMGGTDDGAPGPRGDGSRYQAYFRDPQGNKLSAVHRSA